MFTYTQAIEALETILAQVENDGEMFDAPVADSTIEAVREALYALQAEEAIQCPTCPVCGAVDSFIELSDEHQSITLCGECQQY